MTKKIDAYYEWLVSQINPDNETWTYEGIFKRMFIREFVWLVPNDDNRIGDAFDLRREFWKEDYEAPATILEILVALSRRAAWVISDIEAPDWAWIFIKNLGLAKLHDPIGYKKDTKIEDILEAFVFRNYAPNGEGGLFPLRSTENDQRTVEIWYQMHAYINENMPV